MKTRSEAFLSRNVSGGGEAHVASLHRVDREEQRVAAGVGDFLPGAVVVGDRALDTDAPEATKGFLLNHLIHELLPPKGDGLRWANSDPITGQAAWFDLRVKIAKTDTPNEAQPAIPPIKSPVPKGPAKLAWKVGK